MTKQNRSVKLALVGGLSVTALVFAGPALAQGTQTSSDGIQAEAAPRPGIQAHIEQDRSGELAEIVVTAQKRAENLQTVPISVAAVTSQTVDNLHATTLQGLQGVVPNVQIGTFSNTPNNAVFTIRGIGVIEADPYAGNTVSIVVDGVPQFFQIGALLDLYDLDRIEVLRGPQGTLFGANTTGGVVNVVNTQPKMDGFGGKLDLSYGNHNHIQAGGAINVPLGENLAGRFVVSHDRRDGWMTNVFNGNDLGKRNVSIFRGALRYQPATNIDVNLSGEYDRARNGSPIVVNGAVPGEFTFVPEGFRSMYRSPCLSAGSPCHAPDKYRSAHDPGPIDPTTGRPAEPLPDRSDMDTYRGTLTVNVRDTSIGDVTSITAYKEFQLFEFTDQDSTPIFLIDNRRRTKGWQFSQELRTDVQLFDRISLLIGGFYLKTHYDHRADIRIDFAGGATYDQATGTVTKGFPGLYQANTQHQNNYSVSAFAQAYVDLTDKLRLQAGMRYAHEKTSMLAATLNSFAPGGVTTFDGTAPDGTPNVLIRNVAPPRATKSWDNVGWKLGLDYKVVRDAMVYGYWARGFKSGGFTGRIGIPQDLGPYAPEHVDTFELGLKADFLGRRLRTNLAAFYTNYRDIQLAQVYFAGSGADLVQGNTILNAASAHIKGFEAEVVAAPFRGLTLNGSLAYLSANYNKFPFQLPDSDPTDNIPASVISLKGQRLQNSPKWTASAGLNYEVRLAGMEARLHASYNYVSEKLYNSILNVPRSRIQPVHLVNANADLMITDNIQVGVWATNLFDKRYLTGVIDLPGTGGIANYAPPREYGVSLRYNW